MELVLDPGTKNKALLFGSWSPRLLPLYLCSPVNHAYPRGSTTHSQCTAVHVYPSIPGRYVS